VADDRTRARDAYQKALAIREKLFAADQANVQLQRELALTYGRLGGLAVADGAGDEAKVWLGKDLALRQQIAASDPDNALWQTELIVSLVQSARAGDEPQAHLEQALALAQKLDAAGKLNANQKGLIGSIQQALAAPQQGK